MNIQKKCNPRWTHQDCTPGIAGKLRVLPEGFAPRSRPVSDWLCNAWILSGTSTPTKAILRNPDWATAAAGSQNNHGRSSPGRPSTSPLRTSKRKSDQHRKRLTTSAAVEAPPLGPTSSPCRVYPNVIHGHYIVSELHTGNPTCNRSLPPPRPGGSKHYKLRMRTPPCLSLTSGRVLSREDCEWIDEETDHPGCVLYGCPPSALPL